MSSLPPVPARFSCHSLLNDCSTILGPITLATKIEVFLAIGTNNEKVKKKNMEIIQWDQVTGILSNSNKCTPDFESLKSLISRLFFCLQNLMLAVS